MPTHDTLAPTSTTTPTTPTRSAESSVARWGGLAGLAGSVLMLAVAGFLMATTGLEEDLTAPAAIAAFPQVGLIRSIENAGYLAALLLWVPLAVALAHRLRTSRPAAAVFGGALNGLGLAVLVAGALPHLVSSRLSDLYQASGATAEQQSSLIQLWAANDGLFEALVVTGALTMSVGSVGLGLAMWAHPAFGRGVATVGLALGVVGLAGAASTLFMPESLWVGLSMLALVAFHAVVGWKTFRTAAF